MDKNYNAKLVEEKWIKKWEEQKTYKFAPESEKEIYSVDTPPPSVSADNLHLGHAMSYIQAEIIVRYKRMAGYNVFYPMGFDDNGLPTERFVEKKHNINKSKISRQDFIKLCIKETEKGAENYRRIWTELGIGVDWSLKYNTIGELAQRIGQRSFIDLHKKGLVYQEEAPTFWCTNCRTALAQADLEDEEEKSKMYYIKFFRGEKDMLIGTTRPEMLAACVALYVNPNDNRFKSLIGQKARVPIFNQEVEIKTHAEVDLDKGTGLMMVCTWGDAEDIKKWKEDKLETKIIIDEAGRLTEKAGQFQGLKLKEAREKIVEELKKTGSLEREEEIEHAKNVHERCGTPIEFLPSRQWFVKLLDFKAEFIKRGQELQWLPGFMKNHYNHWINGLKWDWCISRDRYFGVPFPVWHCDKCKSVALPEDKDLPVDPRDKKPQDVKCECGNASLRGEQLIMDTWMTSSVTPLINAKWQEPDSLQDKIYPMSLRIQAHEIIRTWLFYTMVKSYYHTKTLPWETVMISGWGVDQNGKKMSKSKGNVVLIDKTISEYSADAIRWWATSSGLGQNLRHSEAELKSGKKLANKLWNVARFIQPIIEGEAIKPVKIVNFSDRWILAELEELKREVTRAFEVCDFNKARIALEKFFWMKYCDAYLELGKDRAWNPDKYSPEEIASLKFTLFYSAEVLLKLFAPILPFATEEIYHVLFKKQDSESIHQAEWLAAEESFKNDKLLEQSSTFMDIINKIRHFKSNVADTYRSPASALSLNTEDEIIKQALGDLSALVNAQDAQLNKDMEGEKYEFTGGSLILKK